MPHFARGFAAIGAAMLLTAPSWAATPSAVAEPINVAPAPPAVRDFMNRVVPPPVAPRQRRPDPRAASPTIDSRTTDLRAALLPSPTGDAFFDRWPSNLSQLAPGTVISVRRVTATAPAVLEHPVRRAVQLKFATTDSHGAPSFGTATLLYPTTRWRGRGHTPVLVDNLAIDALGARCTPGYAMAHARDGGTNVPDRLPPTIQWSLDRGLIVLVPDHQGARMAYAEPIVGGRVVLDSVRAMLNHDAQTDGGLGVSAAPLIMSGFSGGAIATHGAVKQLATYAPELTPRFRGTALGGLPADFSLLPGSMNANWATGVLQVAALGLIRERPQLLGDANNLAIWLAMSPIKDSCTAPAGLIGPTMWPMQLMSRSGDPFHSPLAKQLYRVTSMRGIGSATPLFVYHGSFEWWVPAVGARAFVAEQCRLGVSVDYHEFPAEHFGSAFLGFPDALSWLESRAGGPRFIPSPIPRIIGGCPRPPARR
ncbi:lipase family protein [Gordonia crocea]|uniref:Putative lipase n=1 Tax=Gordonia crocea TaxID=589162 RepID=A0A7M3SVR0_9ACTN|nr:lipase family protein [Gordonia crocea]GED96734.1 putative lipase [Gordonia crocea]